MPASLIALTEGSGKNLETFQWVIGANTVERQVIALGEQHLASYVSPFGANAISVATANSHVGQIMAGASLKVRIRRVEISQIGLATTAAFCQWIIVRLTTAGTGGTATTINPLDPGDAAAGATAMTLPTVKGTEGVTLWSGSSYFIQTAGASTQNAQPMTVIDFDKLRPKAGVIAAGIANGIAIKNITAIAAATVTVTIWADESNF